MGKHFFLPQNFPQFSETNTTCTHTCIHMHNYFFIPLTGWPVFHQEPTLDPITTIRQAKQGSIIFHCAAFKVSSVLRWKNFVHGTHLIFASINFFPHIKALERNEHRANLKCTWVWCCWMREMCLSGAGVCSSDKSKSALKETNLQTEWGKLRKCWWQTGNATSNMLWVFSSFFF